MGATRSAGMHTHIGSTPAPRSGLEIRLLITWDSNSNLRMATGYRLWLVACLDGLTRDPFHSMRDAKIVY